jgi:hypothetical protein
MSRESNSANSTGIGALRVTLRVDGEQMKIIDQKPVAMLVPASDELQIDTPQSGFWYELQDGEGHTLYRRLTSDDPTSKYVEVPTGDPEQPLAYEEVDQPRRIVSIVIPNVPEGRSLVFFASRPESVDHPSRVSPELLIHSRAFKAREVARFKLLREE